MSVECPVTGEACRVCSTSQKCVTEANRILALAPDEYSPEITIAAAQLGIDGDLYAEFVYERAFGPGSSIGLGSESDPPDFS